MESLALLWLFVQYGQFLALAFSLSATAIHGGEELVGWWGKRAWWLFLVAQTSFVVLAIWGLAFGAVWAVAALIALRLADGIGFHTVFFPQWPGRDTRLLPLADAALLTTWLLTHN